VIGEASLFLVEDATGSCCSAGSGACIGASFAMIGVVVLRATLARALRFFPVAGRKPKPVARVTLRPGAGMPLCGAAR
jgi:cytochrome P450